MQNRSVFLSHLKNLYFYLEIEVTNDTEVDLENCAEKLIRLIQPQLYSVQKFKVLDFLHENGFVFLEVNKKYLQIAA
jgi:hypothetical protein